MDELDQENNTRLIVVLVVLFSPLFSCAVMSILSFNLDFYMFDPFSLSLSRYIYIYTYIHIYFSSTIFYLVSTVVLSLPEKYCTFCREYINTYIHTLCPFR